jgi:hypothetical protein
MSPYPTREGVITSQGDYGLFITLKKTPKTSVTEGYVLPEDLPENWRNVQAVGQQVRVRVQEITHAGITLEILLPQI